MVSLYFSSASYASRLFGGDELYFVKRQLISFLIGFFFLAIMSVLSLDFLRKILPYIYVATFVLCLMTFLPFIGVDKNGARRWIRFPLLGTFQPSELAKLTVILFLANWFAKYGKSLNDSSFRMWQVVVGFFSIVLVIFLQNDFSTAFFVMIIGLSMLFIAGIKISWFVGFCVVSLPIIILFIFTKTYRVNRLIAFFNPEKYSNGANYQVNAASRAIASGRFFGQGFGGGVKNIEIGRAHV